MKPEEKHVKDHTKPVDKHGDERHPPEQNIKEGSQTPSPADSPRRRN